MTVINYIEKLKDFAYAFPSVLNRDIIIMDNDTGKKYNMEYRDIELTYDEDGNNCIMFRIRE